uniref:Uncharacterized protein n=1 Tax=Rhizophora mucronata TaxID=61149 RepID=A0A2P2Q2S2_RHIMU
MALGAKSQIHTQYILI